MKRLFLFLCALASLMAVLTAGVVAWALFVEQPWLSYENLPFPPVAAKVHAGDVIPLMVKRCSSAEQTRSYAITHSVQTLSGSGKPVVMPSGFVTIEPGCEPPTVSEFNRIPMSVTPGMYRIHGVAVVDGTLRTFAVPWSSQPFEVIP
jgi:hypothetical protein